MYAENGCANGSHAMRDGLCHVNSGDGGGKDVIAPSPLKDSTWMIDSSQAYSGPEDNSTDPRETLTETSTLTYVDAHAMDESGESHSPCGGVVTLHVKEFVLIDDDDDGDMSLREKTVTDTSVMDGNAADLVCGRLLSTSSGSLFECKAEPPAPEAPPVREAAAPPTDRRCCFCAIL